MNVECHHDYGPVRVFDSVRVLRAIGKIAVGEVGLVHGIKDGRAVVDFRRYRTEWIPLADLEVTAR